MATQAQIKAVQQLYVGYLGRAADSAGLAFWADAIAAGTATIESVATGFTLSTEYKAAYDGLSSGDLVDNVYNNVLGRAADAEGKAYWVDALAKGTVTADTLVSFIVTNLGAVDQATINNKTFVAQTYTDTVGANYNAEAGATVLVGVDSTPASVTAALAAISGGTLNGQVPALGLITAIDTAVASQVAFETAGKAEVDALVAKIAASNKAAGVDAATTKTDNIVAATSSYTDKITAVVDDAALARLAVTNATGGDKDTSVLLTRAASAAELVKADFDALTVTEKAAANKYVSAIAAEATAKTGAATATEQGSAIGGLTADATAATALSAHTSATALYDEYVAATPAARLAIDTEFKDSAFYATFKATVAKDAAYADAIKATLAAKDTLDAGTGTSTSTVLIHGKAVVGAADATDGSTAANKYVTDLLTKTAADALVVKAQAADADVAAAKLLADAYAVKTDAVDDAKDALSKFDADGVLVTDLSGGAATAITADVTVATDAKDVFYFGNKGAIVAGSDFAIGTTATNHFGTGDSIVIGSEYTYNNGALTTGNGNALEFFLVKSDDGVQIVLETAKYGSSTATADATTGVVGTAAGAADTTAVITLTGVTLDHVSVANGVVSYV